MNLLESLKRWTTVVADTGDIEAIAEHKPARRDDQPVPAPASGSEAAVPVTGGRGAELCRPRGQNQADRSVAFMDKLFTDFGCEILKIVPGRVSTEVDAGLSFDTEGTLAKARRLIELYQQAGVGRERILIKIASTWEGIRAAEQLEARRNSLQPDAPFQLRPGGRLAEAGVTLISPFVGRIYDWYRKDAGSRTSPPTKIPVSHPSDGF